MVHDAAYAPTNYMRAAQGWLSDRQRHATAQHHHFTFRPAPWWILVANWSASSRVGHSTMVW
jgi:hypothetical protein